MALQRRLETDRSLAVFAGQFVPLKVITDGNPEWGKWANKYPPAGGGIPIVYVIRADGEMLYGQSGSLDGQELQQLLVSTLKKSGRTFSDDETELLVAVAAEAKKFLDEGNSAGAGRALGRLAKIGVPGELNSHAEPALEIDTLAKRFVEGAQKSLEEAAQQLGESEKPFSAVLAVVEAQHLYAPFPALKATAAKMLLDVKKQPALKEGLAQAEALVKARRGAASDNVTVRNSAKTAYAAVLARFPGSEAAQLAKEELAVLDPKAAASRETPPAEAAMSEFRTWTDSTGKFRIEARLSEFKDGVAHLEKRDGTKLQVPAAKLSAADQTHLNGN